MAGTTGLEPAASAVTGQRSNQLNYVPTRQNAQLPVFAGIAMVAQLPNLLRTFPVPCSCNASENRSKLSSRNYPNSFLQKTKGLLL